jgi:hypothetical protein
MEKKSEEAKNKKAKAPPRPRGSGVLGAGYKKTIHTTAQTHSHTHGTDRPQYSTDRQKYIIYMCIASRLNLNLNHRERAL